MSNIKNWRDEFAQKIADRINQAVAEARRDEARRCAADVCQFCREGKTPERHSRIEIDQTRIWHHGSALRRCEAYLIHERLHRESQKGGNHEKAETQAGAD